MVNMVLLAHGAAGDDVGKELLIDDAVVSLLLHVQPEQNPHLLFVRLVAGIHLIRNTFKTSPLVNNSGSFSFHRMTF